MILLRFRDLSIPDGETIRRHTDVIATRGYVWWGWITRGHESHPIVTLTALSRQAVSGGTEICMIHTGTGDVFSAQLTAVHGDLSGTRTVTPEFDNTPVYMHESRCPIWFKLASICVRTTKEFNRVVSFPTLNEPSPFDLGLLEQQPVLSSAFSQSGATLWEVDS